MVSILVLYKKMKRKVHYNNLNDSDNYEEAGLQRDEIQLVQIVPTEDEWVEPEDEWAESNNEDTAELLTDEN